ncbi:hypothetical protein vBYenM636_31 [Yersinia phage vB_YenM_636]|nr:hypothetical protein X1_26 [Yersinia phage vB_Yen_X1]QKN86282.1 hypothetical protein vBYenM12_31 [Yersinia phage vB_YenM_12]QKN86373.1 hypothetical protein vBYenM22_31 [Yersinia phage vB_YenM_22]QKN86464.1 hypothetical protein vBYenM25_31 [Yersinia phage vB_YenM_25]QKN86555.1 hypothetical protein vBYenM27_31 [Yersinia phage vB_YenM_27]QKN86646.1 hypothetical protein vBYenM39_31 [Yersinia phage vB_YenM_39]QKN86737.1 hypothetical protein vBYenM126_31 [Yersinia phage vB_YenM_126]QKN86828.1 h
MHSMMYGYSGIPMYVIVRRKRHDEDEGETMRHYERRTRERDEMHERGYSDCGHDKHIRAIDEKADGHVKSLEAEYMEYMAAKKADDPVAMKRELTEIAAAAVKLLREME